MVRVTDVQGGFLDLSKTLRVSEEVFHEFTRRYAPKKGDMVFSRVGSYGNVSYARTDTPFCLGQNTALISPHINGRFLHLFLQSAEARWQIEQVVVGSTQKTISLKSISALQIPIPPPDELEAIAAVLGALDDKIELNRRMNATLEAMARALFQSWFVDFDPVRAKLDGRPPPLSTLPPPPSSPSTWKTPRLDTSRKVGRLGKSKTAACRFRTAAHRAAMNRAFGRVETYRGSLQAKFDNQSSQQRRASSPRKAWQNLRQSGCRHSRLW
jgi:hypothetical protein